MTNFQNKVNIYPALGVPGAFASTNPIASTAVGYIASADLLIGGFCWADPTKDGCVTNKGTGAPIGFVVREVAYPIYSMDGAQDFVPAGCNASVMVRGDFYVQTPDAAAVGQKVFANLTTGEVKPGIAGSTVADYIQTNYSFVTAAEAEGIAIISNYGA